MFVINNEAIYTLEEISKGLQVSVYTLRDKIRTGKIKAIKAGHRYRIVGAELNRFLMDQVVPVPQGEKKPGYCTRPAVTCGECSLVSYDRDCQNNEVKGNA